MYFNRFRLQRLWAWVAPILVFVILFALLHRRVTAQTGETVFYADEAYRGMVVATALLTSRTYGMSAAGAIPMVNGMLWRGLLALASGVVGDPVAAALMLGLVLSTLTLVLMVASVHRLYPHPVCTGMVALLLACSPPLFMAGYSGYSLALAMLLSAGAVYRHITDLNRSGRGLPFTAMALTALAMWIRLEFIVVWMALWIHTVILACWPGEQRLSIPAVLLRGVNGIIVLALLLWPVFFWNVQVVYTPWPRLPAVPLPLWGAGSDHSWWVWAGAGWARMGREMMSVALPGGVVGRLFLLVGAALLIWRSLVSSRERVFLIALVLPLTVFLLSGPLYPFTDGRALHALALAVAPFCWMLAAYGVAYLPFQFGKPVMRRIRFWPEQRIFAVWWLLAGLVLVGSGWRQQRHFARNHLHDLQHIQSQRAAIVEQIREHGLARDRFVTDEPGWLVHTLRVAILDVSGEWTPGLLAGVDRNGEWDEEWVKSFLANIRLPPGVALLWDAQRYPCADWLGDPQIILAPDDEEPARPLMVMNASPAYF